MRTVPTARELRRTVVVALAVVVVTLGFASVAAAECSDYTTGNRDCTAIEALGHCLTNAWQSYEECLDSMGWLGDWLVCGPAAQADVAACYTAFPVMVLVS